MPSDGPPEVGRGPSHPLDPTGRGALALVLATNLLPLAGVVAFDWRVGELLAVYWIEVVAMVLAYSAAALFAERPIDLDDRAFYVIGYSEDTELDEERWETTPEPIHLASWLPPVYRRNASVVVRSLGVFYFVAFPLAWVGGDILSYATPSVGVAALGVCLAQIAEVRREFFAERAYEEQSPYMVVEAAQRVVLFYLVIGLFSVPAVAVALLVVQGLVGAGTLDAVAAAVGPQAVLLPFLVPITLAKTLVEWSRRRAFREDDPDGIATWFTGEDPRREWKQTEETAGED
ncbi:DUF6498-containing protein [Halorubrum trapanicum]|uniref:DUF6498-containing protein n=1 Tax=Halorubrum trapanicum TaxID=29284 RepID=UPI000BBAA9E4|nr:DUF6498-containing protein [Halorubrum trapanicum]